MPAKVRVRTYVNPAVRDEFIKHFPGNGGLSWILETAMRELLELTKGQPEVKELVRRSIRAAILRERQNLKAERSNAPKPSTTRSEPPVTVYPLKPFSAILESDRAAD